MSSLAPCPGCGASNDLQTRVTPDPEIERISELCWRAFHGPRADVPFGKSIYGHCWRAVALAILADRAPALRWRREPPDVPGWWWHRHAGMHSHWRCNYYDARECVDMREYADPRVEWAGPIPEPEPEESE